MNFAGKYQDLIQADKLHVLSLSVLIDKLTNSRGGTGANIAYNSALLGEHPILLGSIGKDSLSYLDDLTDLGINTSHVHKSDLPTATFTVMTDSQDNQIGGFYPGAMSDITHLTLEPWYGKKALVVISANDPVAMDQLVKECIKHNLDYIYDLGQQVTNISVKQMKLGLSKAKVLIGNDYELGTILGRTGYSETQLNSLVPVIVTTLGAEGTKITGSSVKDPLIVKAVQGLKPVDPTGAGDAYRAGFLYGYLRNFDLAVCAKIGSVTSIYTILLHGTQTHSFTLRDVQQKLFTHYGAKII